MANINKPRAIKMATGLPTKEQIMTAPQNVDTVPASIDGETPAALTEGEFVFSLPAIIALGEGNYDQGLQLITQMHDELREVGVPMVEQMQQESPQQEGLARIPMG